MKLFIPLLSTIGLTLHPATAFTPSLHALSSLQHAPSTATLLHASAPLTPEPEGGEELTKISSSLPDSRMKNMGLCTENNPDGDVYTFWLSAVADGEKVKKMRIQTEKEASKNANFPGFRKGQIPPYALPKMNMFAVQEAVIKTCEESLEAYGLESLQGSEGEVTVNEDMQVVCKGYKLGTDVPFTATYRGKFDKVVQSSMEGAVDAEEVVVDVEAVAVDAEEVVVDVEVVADSS